jgi:thiamine kinase-like enzyme
MADDHHNVRLIDFEYGNYNFLCYDIANHFSEMYASWRIFCLEQLRYVCMSH